MDRKPIASGNTAEVYEWGPGRVLKLYRPGMGAGLCQQEFAAAVAARAVLARVPAVYEQIEVGGRPGIVYQRIEGESMLDFLQAHPEKWRAKLLCLAGLHVEINSQSPVGLPTLHHRLAVEVRRSKELTEAERGAVLRRLEALPPGGWLCHGDFHPGNVLLAAGGPVVIDWMTASMGDPAADVARTELILRYARTPEWMAEQEGGLTGFPAGLADRYREEYCRLSGLDPKEIDPWLVPVAAARLNEWLPKAERADLLALVRKE